MTRSFGFIAYIWKGELASAPASPAQNWVYRNSTNKSVYLYDSGVWTLMVKDGIDGKNGESPQFQIVGRMLQYRFATQTPTVWTDLFEFPLAPTYVHDQTVASDVWNIQHNLGGQPVTILAVDDTGDQIIGQQDIQASTINLLVYRFSEPLTGKAYIKF